MQLSAHRPLHPEPLATGPRSPHGPTVRFERGEKRARCRGGSPTTAGAARHAKAREIARSTRNSFANNKRAAQLFLGHRRRRTQQRRQWRTRWRGTARRKWTVSMNYGAREGERRGERSACSPRVRWRGRRGTGRSEAVRIVDDVRSVQKREIDDGDETRASQLARLGEVVEDVQAELLVAAIWKWRAGTPAIWRRSSSTARPWLGFARERERDRGRGKGVRARGEELVGGLLIHGASTAWTGRRARGGGATLAVATGAGEDDRE